MEEEQKKGLKKFKKPIFLCIGIFLLFCFFGVDKFLNKKLEAEAANAPAMITYQGKLLDNGSAATTTKAMYFILYDSLVGGNILYTASGTTASLLHVSTTPSNGLFSINLGDTSVPTNAIDPSIFQNNTNIYLEVRIGAQTLTPRKQITASPFAFNAKYLDGVAATSTASTTTYIPISASDGSFRFNTTTIATSTITSATITSSTITSSTQTTANILNLFGLGEARLASTTISGNLLLITANRTSLLSVSSTNFSSAGFLNVTGQSTLANVSSTNYTASGYLDVAGQSTLTNVSSTNITGSGYLNIGGNATLVGDLGVSGTTTLATSTVASSTITTANIGSLFISNSITLAANSLVSSAFADRNNIAFLNEDETVGGLWTFSATTTFATSTFTSSTINNANVGNLSVVGTVSGIDLVDVAGTGVLAFLANDQTFTGINIFTTTTIATSTITSAVITSSTITSSTIITANINNLFGFTQSTLASTTISGNLLLVTANNASMQNVSSTNLSSSGYLNVTGQSTLTNVSSTNYTASGYLNVTGQSTLTNVSSTNITASGYTNITGQTTFTTASGTALTASTYVSTTDLTASGALTVGGNTYFSAMTNGSVIFSGASGQLTQDNTNFYWDDNTDRLGIGNNARLYTLSVGTGDVFGVMSNGDISTSGSLKTFGNVTSTGILYAQNGLISSASSTFSNNLHINGNLGIGTSTPQAKMHLTGGNFLLSASNPSEKSTIIRTQIDGNQLNGAKSVYVSGKYAYVVSIEDNSLSIIDISNPASSTAVGYIKDGVGATQMDGANAVFVSGKYAYVVSRIDNALTIIDVSNPSNPTEVGHIKDGAGATQLDGAYSLFVSGKYAYVVSLNDNSLSIIDISNPVSPTEVGTIVDGAGATQLANPASVYVSGRYAYIASSVDDSLSIIDISNPVSPTEVGTIVDGAGATQLDGASSVYVSGKYAYVAAADDSAMSIIDISDPANSKEKGVIVDDSKGGSATRLFNPIGIQVVGKYAYIASSVDDSLSIIDISNPVSPTEVGTIVDGAGATQLDGASSVYVSGKYAYVAAQYDDALSIVDISGIDAPSANIGSIESSVLTVTENAEIGNNLSVRNGLNIGPGGIMTQGVFGMFVSSSVSGLSQIFNIYSSSTTSVIPVLTALDNGNIGIGDNSPLYPLTVGSGDLFGVISNGDVSTSGSLKTFGNVTSTGILYAQNGFISSASSTIGANLYMSGHILPNVNNLYDLANLGTAWRNIYASSSVNVGDGTNSSTLKGNYLALGDGSSTSTFTATSWILGQIAGSDLGKFYIDSNGNMSTSGTLQSFGNTTIGASTASATLWVYGTVTTTGNIRPEHNNLYDLGGYNYAWRDIYASGTLRVGSTSIMDSDELTIGTASGYDQGLFYVDSSNSRGNVFASGTLALTNSTLGVVSSTASDLRLSADTIGKQMQFWTSSTERMRIDSNGNVGVGTTTPQGKFHVSQGTMLVDTPSPVLSSTTLYANFAQSVYVSGRYAYIADGSNGLKIIDISDSVHPSLVGRYAISDGSANGVVVSGKKAYLAVLPETGSENLLAIDVSNPSNPALVGSGIGTSNAANAVDIVGRHVFVAAGDQFETFDIGAGTVPVSIGATTGGGYVEVDVNGKYAYVADLDVIDGNYSLNIKDISSGIGIQVGKYRASAVESVMKIKVLGKYAYMLTGGGATNNFLITDISNPSTPVNMSTTTLSDSSLDLFVSGKYAYVCDSAALRIFDVSSSTAPYSVGSYAIPRDIPASDYITDIFISGKNAYITRNAGGLTILDLGGVDSHAARIGSLESSDLLVQNNGDIGNNLSIRNGLNVGQGGIMSDGGITTSGTLSFTDPVAGTTTFANTGVFVSLSTSASPDGFIFRAGTPGGGNEPVNLFRVTDADADRPIFTIKNNGGMVGIGTDTPSYTLTVGDNKFGVDGGTGNISASGTLTLAGTNSIISGKSSGHDLGEFYVDSSGNVSVSGTLLLANALTISKVAGYNSGRFYVGADGSIQSSSSLQIGTIFTPFSNNTSDIGSYSKSFRNIYASSTIYAGGGLSVTGTSGADIRIYGLTVGGSVQLMLDTGTGANNMKVFRTASSRRYKTNIQDFSDDYNKILSVRPVTFDWISTGSNNLGYIAEEFDELGLNSLVLYDPIGRPDAINYDAISIYLIGILKQQQQNLNNINSVLTIDNENNNLIFGSSTVPYDIRMAGTMSFLDTGLGQNKISFATSSLFESSVGNFDSAGAFVFNASNFTSSSASQKLLSLRSGGEPVFSVSANGDVNTVGDVRAKNIVVGSPGQPGDLAERVDIAVEDTVEPGDVLVVDADKPDTYRKSRGVEETAVAGVVSTNPTIVVGNGKTDYTAVMAMVGRVPVKVTTENGAIQRGDLLVTAGTAGHAMKYDPAKDSGVRMVGVIGVALEASAEGRNKVMALIRTGWVYNRDETISSLRQNITELASMVGASTASSGDGLGVGNNGGQLSYVNGNLDLSGNSLLNVASVRGKENKWMIGEDGRFITRLDTTAGQKEMFAMQSPTSEFVFSSSSQLLSGEARIIFDQATKDIIDFAKALKINVTLTSGDGNGVYVSAKTEDGFIVKELKSGMSNSSFDWIVVAQRKENAADQQVPEQPVSEPPAEPPAPPTPPTDPQPPTPPVENPPSEQLPTPPVNTDTPSTSPVVNPPEQPTAPPVESPPTSPPAADQQVPEQPVSEPPAEPPAPPTPPTDPQPPTPPVENPPQS